MYSEFSSRSVFHGFTGKKKSVGLDQLASLLTAMGLHCFQERMYLALTGQKVYNLGCAGSSSII